MVDTSVGRAAAIPLTDEEKCRVMFLLLMHQRPLNYDEFESGYGHSTRAIQKLVERLQKKYVKDWPSDAAAGTVKAAGEKRGRTKNVDDDEEEPVAKKGRKTGVKKEARVADDGDKLIKEERQDSVYDSQKTKTATPETDEI